MAAVRFRPALTRLLVVLLLLQWGTALGHCLRLAAPAPGFTVEICTAEGLHRVTLPGGEDAPAEHAHAGGICPACQGPAAFALLPPTPGVAAPVVLAQSADPPPPPQPQFPTPPRSCQPRAPPTS
ncbi:hypothetical protein DFH01_02170 [Falsiroseomonas bella]|uniref:DUF2946 domain-containing protein n=1 Tax=Falsiroseomonas bella TaxID=2184016 RepID=A0A317FJK1_9PROT|nr:DUF2946 family protein [Falsiroseomonas bella]PWS38129.1 hypothetical protein DFH01_02170 [Falsiroseomonas bella]